MLLSRSVSDAQGGQQSSDIVLIKVGEWSCKDDISWKFVASRGQMARCMTLKNDMGFSDLLLEIVNVFGVDMKKYSLALTFWFPEETIALTQNKMPPLSIESDSDLNLFRKKRLEIVGLSIYVSLKEKVINSTRQQEDSGNVNCFGVGSDACGEEDLALDDDVLLAFVEGVESWYMKNINFPEDNPTAFKNANWSNRMAIVGGLCLHDPMKEDMRIVVPSNGMCMASQEVGLNCIIESPEVVSGDLKRRRRNLGVNVQGVENQMRQNCKVSENDKNMYPSAGIVAYIVSQSRDIRLTSANLETNSKIFVETGDVTKISVKINLFVLWTTLYLLLWT